MAAVKPRRRYRSPRREERANATRERLLAAAARLFADHGFPAVTMEAIAREAGVALATLYQHFPGRTALVEALADGLVAAPDLSVEHVIREPDPVEQLRAGAGIMRRLNERAWAVADLLRSARGRDEDLARLWARWQERHLNAVRRAAAALAGRGALREGLEADEAADVLYALAGTEVYRLLVHERSWAPERYERWLFETGLRQLLPDGRAREGETG